jgi:hypothetical protein
MGIDTVATSSFEMQGLFGELTRRERFLPLRARGHAKERLTGGSSGQMREFPFAIDEDFLFAPFLQSDIRIHCCDD